MAVPRAEFDEYRPWSHRAAWLVACATFPLIWVGGLVTTYDAGMAVPDWPSTFGYNLFLYPWQSWIAGPWDLFIEHGHRLLGSLVGMLAILLVVTTWSDSRRWVRYLSIAALLLVILQGLLGGQRVLLNDRRIAQLHGCVGPLFFVLAVMLTTVTSRAWRKPLAVEEGSLDGGGDDGQRSRRTVASSTAKRVRGWAVAAWIAFGLSVGQLLLGSQLRHGVEYSNANAPVVFRGAVVFHVVLACCLMIQVLWLGFRLLRHRSLAFALTTTWLAGLLITLVFGQLLLGLGTWAVKYGWPTLLAQIAPRPGFTVQAESMWQSLTVTGHVAMGSLVLATTGMLAVRLTRIHYRLSRTVIQPQQRVSDASKLSSKMAELAPSLGVGGSR